MKVKNIDAILRAYCDVSIRCGPCFRVSKVAAYAACKHLGRLVRMGTVRCVYAVMTMHIDYSGVKDVNTALGSV